MVMNMMNTRYGVTSDFDSNDVVGAIAAAGSFDIRQDAKASRAILAACG